MGMSDKPGAFDSTHRPVCYACFKPFKTCICGGLERVETDLGVTILQHPRERNHPIGTARIAALGMSNCRLLVCGPREAKLQGLNHLLPPKTMLLYPSPTAIDVHELDVEEMPEHLLLLDGTWSHSYALYKSAAWMQSLPHLKLRNPTPSRYRIRKEPARHCVSTIEAIAQTFAVLEPDVDLSPLMKSFDRMIDQQAEFERNQAAPRRRKRRKSKSALSARIREHLHRSVLLYSETHEVRGASFPIYVTACRVRTGETFECVVNEHGHPVTPRHHENMGLAPTFFEGGVSQASMQNRFEKFLNGDDVLTSWNQTPLRALAGGRTTLQLKAVYSNLVRGPSGHLREVLCNIDKIPKPTPFSGRAKNRMAAMRAVHEYFLELE